MLRKTSKLIRGSQGWHIFSPGKDHVFGSDRRSAAKDTVAYAQFQLLPETIDTVRVQRRKLLLRAIEPVKDSTQ